MTEKVLGLTAAELKQELLRIGQICNWIPLEEKDGLLVFHTEAGQLTLSWSSLPAETLGSFAFPRTLLQIRGQKTAIKTLNQALRCLRAGG